MGLDIRLPIGMMFSLIGLLLTVNGYLTASDTARYRCSLGININLNWGIFLLIFGGGMLVSALLGKKAAQKAASQPEEVEVAKR